MNGLAVVRHYVRKVLQSIGVVVDELVELDQRPAAAPRASAEVVDFHAWRYVRRADDPRVASPRWGAQAAGGSKTADSESSHVVLTQNFEREAPSS